VVTRSVTALRLVRAAAVVLGVIAVLAGSLLLWLTSGGPVWDRDEECARAVGVDIELRRTYFTVERRAGFPADWWCTETSSGRSAALLTPARRWAPVGLVAGGVAALGTGAAATVPIRRRGAAGGALRRRRA